MSLIADWFNGSKDYYEGVAIYATLPTKKLRILKKLNRGKNNHNMSTLVEQLRQYKNAPQKPQPPKKTPVIVENYTEVPDQEKINITHQRKKLAAESNKREFGGVLIGDLPTELRPRFFHAQKVFYEMIELKFALNDLPPEAEESALNILIQIMKLDEERDLIWKELHHWKKHRTLLSVPEDDFSKLTPTQLIQKYNNLKSNISKINQRVNKMYESLVKETNRHNKLLIEAKITRSEDRLHTHKLNMKKIKELI
tara:strand:+ start:6499 stop:7260 length:762 start_codon:yes stop_codon:yes gene_type:complete